MDREHTCCFTGHRPDKLPWGTDERDPRCTALKRRLTDAIAAACAAGSRHFICGMALGSDLYFAEGVLALRQDHPDVTLECARPCESRPLARRRAAAVSVHSGPVRLRDLGAAPLRPLLHDPAQPLYGGSLQPHHRGL